MENNKRKHAWRISLGVFLVALTVRAIYLYLIQPLPFTTHLSLDAASYDHWAQRIAAGDWLGDRVFYQAPLYPYVLGLLYAVFGHSLNLVRALQLVIGALNCMLIFWIGERVFGKKQALWTAGITLFYGIFVFYEGAIGKDGLSIFLSNMALWGFLVSADKPAWHRWLLTGAAFGCAVLTRGNLILLAPFMALWAVVAMRGHPRRTMVLALLSFVVGTGITISPATIRNYIVDQDLVLSTSQAGQNFYIGNNPRANGFFENPERIRLNPKYEEDDFMAEALRKTGRNAMKPSEISGFWFQEGLRFIRDNPAKAFALTAKKTAMFWNRFEIPDNYNYDFYRNRVVILQVLFLGFGIVAPLGLFGFILARRNPGTWLLALFVFGYMASIVPFHMASRYRLPIVPPLIILAGYSLQWMVETARARRYGRLGAAVALLCSLVLAVNWKVVDERTTFKAPYTELGIIAAQKGEDKDAIEHFEKALSLDPTYAPALYGLGNVYVKQGKLLQAVSAYQKALKADPEFLMSWNNLGKTYVRLGMFDAALESFNEALRLRPSFAEAAAGKGLVFHSLGKYDKAIHAFQKAITANPQYAPGYYNLACAYARQGHREKARAALDKAISLNPKYEKKALQDQDLEILQGP